jgi:segregation and condensation protein B
MQNLEQHIQSIIFSSPQPVSILDIRLSIQKVFEVEIEESVIKASIEDIHVRFATDTFAFELMNTGGGYQFLSKSTYFKTINHFLNIQQKKKLSKPSLETLSIIAYNNGITKGEIEQIRGVASDYSVEKLLEKELIEMAGKKDAPGQPILYKVTQSFLDYFGINSIEELPKLKDIHIPEENAIGEAS